MRPFRLLRRLPDCLSYLASKTGIRGQVIFLVVLLTLICSAGAVFFDVRARLQEDRASTLDAAREISHFITMAAESHLEYLTYVDLQQLIDDAVEQERVDYLALDTGTFHGVEMEALRDKAAKSTASNALLARAYTDKRILINTTPEWVYVARPLSDRRQVVGGLLVGMKTTPVIDVLKSIVTRQLAITLPIFLFGLCVVFIMTNKVIWPLQKMTEAAEGMALGRLDLTVKSPPYREIGQLSRAFKRMSERVNQGVLRIQELAFRDTLTGLPNRTQFEQSLAKVIDRCGDKNRKLAVIFVNVVEFKRVNDTLGHDRGDLLLVEVGRRLKKLVDDFNRNGGKKTPAPLDDDPQCGAMVARFQADDFSIYIPGLEDGAAARALSEWIQAAMADAINLDGTVLFVATVIGISMYPDHGTDNRKLLRSAELALFHARSRRQDRIAFFTGDLDLAAQNNLHLENDLHKALATSGLSVMFQPKVDLKTGRVVGAEALARWQHPDRGLISPAEFVPIAERSALILTLGEWIMQKSLDAAVLWVRKGFPVSVAVNVSSVELEQPDFASRVRRQLKETGLPPHLLEIEVTETFAVLDVSPANAQMELLQADGVRFAIDDFGTGYSNLSQLKRASFDVFKIDRSFTSKMKVEPEARTIVKTIIAMADTLNYSTVAEGVETEDEAQALRECGCMIGQGYLFAKPMPLARFMNFLRNAQDPVATLQPIPKSLKNNQSA